MATPGKKPGSPKTGGRQKGTPNANKQEFRDLLAEAARNCGHERGKKGFDPLIKLAEIYFEFEELGVATAPARVEILLKTLEYSYPKKKAVEVSGPDGGPIEVDLSGVGVAFDKLARAPKRGKPSDA